MGIRFASAAAALGMVVAAVLSACGGGGGGVDAGGTGQLRVALTDAPTCGYDAVNVTVERVRVHTASTADDADGGWREIVLQPARRVDLLTLTNGVLVDLGTTELPAGRYTQLRLELAANGASAPLANSVVPTGGSETALDTPSAQQSGLKMPVSIDVGANEVADVVLDFDACKSVVRRGNSGRFNLKPVVNVLPRVRLDALVAEGWVSPAVAAAGASVSLQQGNGIVRATVPGVDGRFVLYPVPEGSYDLVVTGNGYATALVSGVPITATSRTFVNQQTAPIAPPASPMRSASGTVSTSGSAVIPLATVSARQAVGATRIELAARPVDGDTGAYAFALPASAPVVTAYAPAASSVTLTPVPAGAGQYDIVASAPSKAPQTKSIDVTAGDVAVPAIVFAP